MKCYSFDKFELLMSKSAVDLFEYFNIEEIHGLSKSDCHKRIKEGGTYFDGLCNYNPNDSTKKPFIFINESSIKNNHEDVTLLMHEVFHLSLMLHEWDIQNKEEEIVTFTEKTTNEVLEKVFLKQRNENEKRI